MSIYNIRWPTGIDCHFHVILYQYFFALLFFDVRRHSRIQVQTCVALSVAEQLAELLALAKIA